MWKDLCGESGYCIDCRNNNGLWTEMFTIYIVQKNLFCELYLLACRRGPWTWVRVQFMSIGIKQGQKCHCLGCWYIFPMKQMPLSSLTGSEVKAGCGIYLDYICRTLGISTALQHWLEHLVGGCFLIHGRRQFWGANFP